MWAVSAESVTQRDIIMIDNSAVIGNDYTYANSMFTAGYIIGQWPSALILSSGRISPRFWFPFCMVAWGLCTLGLACKCPSQFGPNKHWNQQGSKLLIRFGALDLCKHCLKHPHSVVPMYVLFPYKRMGQPAHLCSIFLAPGIKTGSWVSVPPSWALFLMNTFPHLIIISSQLLLNAAPCFLALCKVRSWPIWTAKTGSKVGNGCILSTSLLLFQLVSRHFTVRPLHADICVSYLRFFDVPWYPPNY